ncbi:MAG TPA: PAS domain S-box protein [Puia sp.]|jgi:PAS domain S-box-containing protein
MTQATRPREHLVPLQTILQRWSYYLSLLVLVIGIGLLIEGPAVVPSLTALSFILSAGSLLLLSGITPTSPSIRRYTGKTLATLVLLTGIGKITGILPGMYGLSPLCFLLTGAALLTPQLEIKGRRLPSQYLALLVLGVTLFRLLGYLYRIPLTFGTSTYIPMALPTALTFLILAAAILLVQPGKGILKEFTSSSTGGLTARKLLPLVILLPASLGLIRLVAYWKGLISTELGVTLLVSSIIYTFIFIVWYNARLLNKRDQQKETTEKTLAASEQRFALLVGGVKDYAIFMLDPEGFVISWNEGAERIKGYSKEEIIGKHMSVFYTEEEIEQGEPAYNLSRARELGRYEKEGWRVRKDDTLFWANVIFTTIRNPDGEVLGFAKVTRDITERKEAIDRIAYMARLIEDISDAVFSTDAHFTIRSWNKAAELLFGYSMDEVKGRWAQEVLRTLLDEDTRAAIIKELRQSGYWKGEVIYLKKDNSPLTMFITISAVRDSQGAEDGYVMVCRDLTESKQMELQLRKFNEDLEEQVKIKTAELTGIFERITDAFIAVDKDFCYTYLNKKAGELIHRDPDQLIGKCVWDIFPDVVGSSTYHAFNRAMAEQQNIINTDYYPPLDLWQENHLYPSPDGLSVFIRDISHQKRTEKAITDYKYALDQSSIVSITNEKGIIKYVNDNFCAISKYSREELVGNDHRVIGSSYHAPKFMQQMWRTISKGKVWKGEIRNQAKDGSIYWVDMTIVPFVKENKEPYEYLALDSDITERKKAEELLAQSYQEIRQLASHLQEIREEERAGIAREIHDELGQQLTGLKMDLSWMSKRSSLQQDGPAKEKAAGVLELLDIAIKTVRRIATDLRPSILDDLGLVAAIEWQCQEFQRRSGISTSFNCSIAEFNYSSTTAIGLFRICQESLTNVARHAGAANVSVSLERSDNNCILLKIEDDGKGFDARRNGGKKTLGLLGMRERTLMMGGSFNLTSRVGKGTSLVVTVPLTTSIS